MVVFLSACNGGDSESNEQPEANEKREVLIAEEPEAETGPDEKNKASQSAFSWEKLSGWHTQGTIPRNSPIRIYFNRDVISKEMLGKDASKVMHISPAIEGKPVFESLSKIVWLPTKALQAGTEYKVSITPNSLKDVPKATAPYQFSFHVIPLEFEVKTAGLSSIADSNKMQLTGQLYVSDRVNFEGIKSVLKASLQSKSLPIEWNHSSDGKRHHFTINNIKKETFATDINLSWNGEPINIKSQGTLNIPVPSVNEFKVLDAKVVQNESSNPYVQVRFSDELKSVQDIKGLAQLVKSKYKVRIEKNIINIYPNKNLTGKYTVRLHVGIISKNNKVLVEQIEKEVTFGETKPQVKFVGSGSILPDNTTLEIPFMAVGANAVEVTAFEIYPNQMGQFLQVNKLSGNTETGRTGRYLWRKTVPLTPANANQWNRYSFNVTDMMKNHRGSLLRLTLSIKRQHSSYSEYHHCSSEIPAASNKQTALKNHEDNNLQESSGWDGISDYYEGSSQNQYDWDRRRDPCFDAYFTYNQDKVTASQNFIASNIGLIAKQDATGKINIITTDIRTTEPLTGVELEVKNFQGQVLGKAVSDGNGFAQIDPKNTPFLLVAKKFEDTAYLKLNVKTTLAVSHFDVGGRKIKKGIKGFIYGERGVWRPGDDIFLTFVMQDQTENAKEKLPESHPVTMKLIDPQGRVVESKTSTDSMGGFYAFKFKTKEKAQTGRWLVKAFLGGSTFTKALTIETVRPNRLKIELSFDADDSTKSNEDTVLYSSDGAINGDLFSQWLHGATASNLKADIAVRFSKKRTKFGRFTDYTFDDPSRRLKSEETKILEGRLDESGNLGFSKNIQPDGNAAGMLAAQFTTRVFEEGGAFSISRTSYDYHPYENYVGIKLPKGDATRGMLLTDIKHTVKIGSLDAKGEKTSLPKVKVSLYKINWKWWWDKSADSLAAYADGQHRNLLQSATIDTTDGDGEWQFEIKYPQWGRYMVKACDLEGKHCSGKVVYIDWPGWAGRAQEEGSGAASRLNLFSDKTAYTVGDTATIQLPSSAQGRALLTVETGSRILEQRWIDLNSAKREEGKVKVDIAVTDEMSPNAYVHISMLQPHMNKTNDRPIRLYGIIPLEVSDPNTYLKPKLEALEEWKPESKQTVKVSESNGKPMNYTLAIVDEGLLGLTAFRTPNLHRYFYSKEALGVKTWDLYDHVIGAYGGKLERMLALGGGDEAEKDNEDSKKRRFPPVVQYLGPFHLEAGETSEHNIKIPAYLGAVRVMLVAGEDGAYGKAQQSIFVRQALMLQASLPRTLGPDEDVAVPVTLFATNDSIRKVRVEIKTDDLVNVIGDDKTEIIFEKSGEKIAFINLKTAKKAGKTHIEFTATPIDENGKALIDQQSRSDVYVDISLANAATSRSITKVIEPNTSWDAKAEAFGLAGTNNAVLELSSVPSLNLEKRLNYLIRYPHGCLEQTTSSAFPQLYLSNLMSLNEQNQKKSQHFIQKAIERLKRFQKGSGDFSYWPSGNRKNNWASIYAGHFLIEAKKQGFLVPADLLNNWLNYQVNTAQNFVAGNTQYSHTQSYRLYVLALASKPQIGAMNRLREQAKNNSKLLNNKARWLLASAYQTASQPDAANAVIEGLLAEIDGVKRSDETFSSTLGDLGLLLESLVALDKKQDANKLLEKISAQMNSDDYQSTQGIAWALMAVSRYLAGDTSSFTAKLDEAGDSSEISSNKAIAKLDLKNANSALSVENTSVVRLFATLVNTGVPDAGVEKSIVDNGLEIQLTVGKRVTGKDGKSFWQKHVGSSITQGTDLRFEVNISNTSNHDTDNIALTIPVAAGMEILSADEQSMGAIDYRDIRDDRIHYYFSLKKDHGKIFYLTANAAYKGRYYLPAINAEAMYDGNMKARHAGKWIEIVSEEPRKKEAPKKPANAVGDSPNEKTYTVTKDKLYLYDSMSESTKTKMYLIKGDKAEILTEVKNSDGKHWIYLKYKGKKTIIKWVKVSE